MLTHHVLFWLKPGTTADQKASFKEGLNSLSNIESVKQIYIGTPAPIERAVVDTTYTFSLLLVFDNMDGHDAYQIHDLHQAFLEENRQHFERVVIYDAQ
jgi:hypothetical protein